MEARGILGRFDSGGICVNRSPITTVSSSRDTERLRGYLPSVMLDGKPFSQLLGESHGRAERLSDSVVAQPLTPQAAATSSNAKNQ